MNAQSVGLVGSVGRASPSRFPSSGHRASILRDVLARGLGLAVLRAILPGLPIRASGWTPCRCPNSAAHPHGDATPSASASAELGCLRCHGCGLAADVVDLAVLVGRAPDRASAARWIRAEFVDRTSAPVTTPAQDRARRSSDRVETARSLYAHACRGIGRWADLRDDDPRARLLREYVPSWPAAALDALAVGFLPSDDARGWCPKLVFSVRDLAGEVVAVKLRAVVRDVEPKSLSVGAASRGLIGREQLTAKPGALVVLTAGEKDAAHGLALVPSVAWCSGAIGEGNPLRGLASAFAGRDVVVLFDADAAGVKGAAERRAELAPVARSVRVVTLPRSALGPHGKDLTDAVEFCGPSRVARGLGRMFAAPEGEAK